MIQIDIMKTLDNDWILSWIESKKLEELINQNEAIDLLAELEIPLRVNDTIDKLKSMSENEIKNYLWWWTERAWVIQMYLKLKWCYTWTIDWKFWGKSIEALKSCSAWIDFEIENKVNRLNSILEKSKWSNIIMLDNLDRNFLWWLNRASDQVKNQLMLKLNEFFKDWELLNDLMNLDIKWIKDKYWWESLKLALVQTFLNEKWFYTWQIDWKFWNWSILALNKYKDSLNNPILNNVKRPYPIPTPKPTPPKSETTPSLSVPTPPKPESTPTLSVPTPPKSEFILPEWFETNDFFDNDWWWKDKLLQILWLPTNVNITWVWKVWDTISVTINSKDYSIKFDNQWSIIFDKNQKFKNNLFIEWTQEYTTLIEKLWLNLSWINTKWVYDITNNWVLIVVKLQNWKEVPIQYEFDKFWPDWIEPNIIQKTKVNIFVLWTNERNTLYRLLWIPQTYNISEIWKYWTTDHTRLVIDWKDYIIDINKDWSISIVDKTILFNNNLTVEWTIENKRLIQELWLDKINWIDVVKISNNSILVKHNWKEYIYDFNELSFETIKISPISKFKNNIFFEWLEERTNLIKNLWFEKVNNLSISWFWKHWEDYILTINWKDLKIKLYEDWTYEIDKTEKFKFWIFFNLSNDQNLLFSYLWISWWVITWLWNRWDKTLVTIDWKDFEINIADIINWKPWKNNTDEQQNLSDFEVFPSEKNDLSKVLKILTDNSQKFKFINNILDSIWKWSNLTDNEKENRILSEWKIVQIFPLWEEVLKSDFNWNSSLEIVNFLLEKEGYHDLLIINRENLIVLHFWDTWETIEIWFDYLKEQNILN